MQAISDSSYPMAFSTSVPSTSSQGRFSMSRTLRTSFSVAVPGTGRSRTRLPRDIAQSFQEVAHRCRVPERRGNRWRNRLGFSGPSRGLGRGHRERTPGAIRKLVGGASGRGKSIWIIRYNETTVPAKAEFRGENEGQATSDLMSLCTCPAYRRYAVVIASKWLRSRSVVEPWITAFRFWP